MLLRCLAISLPFLLALGLAAYELESDGAQVRSQTPRLVYVRAERRWTGAQRRAGRLASERRREGAQSGQLRPFPNLVHLACVTFAPIARLADEALLRRVQEGDVDALEALYRAYEGVVFTLGRRLCGTEEAADDVLQETFLEVGRSLGRYRGRGSLEGWIKRICVSKALMRLRRSVRFAHESAESAADLLEARSGSSEAVSSRLDIEHAMMRLGDTARVVVWLHDVEGFTHEEIADLLRMSVSFSKSQLSRAHARLRALLGDDEEAPCGT